MIIAIKKLEDNTIFIDKYLFIEKPEEERIFTDEQLTQPPYNYTKVEIDDNYSDCIGEDFNEDLTFNVDKYNKRKNIKLARAEIAELKTWFDTIYTKQEQKLRRLITLKTLCDDGQYPEDKLITLYNEAELKRKRIQELEVILID